MVCKYHKHFALFIWPLRNMLVKC